MGQEKYFVKLAATRCNWFSEYKMSSAQPDHGNKRGVESIHLIPSPTDKGLTHTALIPQSFWAMYAEVTKSTADSGHRSPRTGGNRHTAQGAQVKYQQIPPAKSLLNSCWACCYRSPWTKIQVRTRGSEDVDWSNADLPITYRLLYLMCWLKTTKRCLSFLWWNGNNNYVAH